MLLVDTRHDMSNMEKVDSHKQMLKEKNRIERIL